jgi:spore coat assemly protein
MSNLKVGDIVARKSYSLDILFKVAEIVGTGDNRTVILKGLDYRLQADAPESDLIVQPEQRVQEQNMRLNRLMDKKHRETIQVMTRGGIKKARYRDTANDNSRKFSRPGKVLHIDGDQDYLDKCLEQYKKIGIDAVGVKVPEKDQPSAVYALLKENRPDILVLTGHDAVSKGAGGYANIENYRNSKYYVAAVREARKYETGVDSLFIFAGACQSLFRDIINAGANYASSPQRVLIHALDPVLVCEKVALARFDRLVDPVDVIHNTITGEKGIGGMQTFGKYRDGYPMETDG